MVWEIQTMGPPLAVKATLRGIRRTFGGAKVRKAPAVAAKNAQHGCHGP